MTSQFQYLYRIYRVARRHFWGKIFIGLQVSSVRLNKMSQVIKQRLDCSMERRMKGIGNQKDVAGQLRSMERLVTETIRKSIYNSSLGSQGADPKATPTK